MYRLYSIQRIVVRHVGYKKDYEGDSRQYRVIKGTKREVKRFYPDFDLKTFPDMVPLEVRKLAQKVISGEYSLDAFDKAMMQVYKDMGYICKTYGDFLDQVIERFCIKDRFIRI